MLLTVCDNVAFTHEIGCEHSARRRGRFIAPVSLHNQIYIFVSLHTHLNIIKYTYPFHRTRVYVPPHTHFRPPFRGCIHICGHDKSAPTAACGLPFRCERIAKTLQTDCENATNTHEIRNEHPRNAQRTLPIWWVNNSLQTCCCIMFVCLQVL